MTDQGAYFCPKFVCTAGFSTLRDAPSTKKLVRVDDR